MFLKKRKANSFALFAIPTIVLVSLATYVMLCTIPVNRVIGVGPGDRDTLAKEVKCEVYKNIHKIKFGKTGLKEVIKLFGEPEQYIADSQAYTKDNLPSWYIADYGNGFKIVIYNDKVFEIRFEYNDTVQYGSIKLGASLDEIEQVMGKPDSTVSGVDIRSTYFKDGVLYTNIDGNTGWSHYMRLSKGVRVFLTNDHVNAIYFIERKD